MVATGATFLLLPVCVALLAPGAVLGYLAIRVYPERRDVWRFDIGMGAGASVVGALLFLGLQSEDWMGQRIVLAAFGGPFLTGFWFWLGGLLGSTYASIGRDEPNGTGPAKPLSRPRS